VDGLLGSLRQNLSSEAVYGLGNVAIAYMVASGVVRILACAKLLNSWQGQKLTW